MIIGYWTKWPKNVIPLTEVQPLEDKLWILARSLRFTSTVGLSFLKLGAKKSTLLLQGSEERVQIFDKLEIQLEYSGPEESFSTV